MSQKQPLLLMILDDWGHRDAIDDELQTMKGTLMVTADHGNAEAKVDLVSNLPLTAHSTDSVPFILVDERFKGQKLRKGGALCKVAPTLLELLNLPKPKEMTGRSLLKSVTPFIGP